MVQEVGDCWRKGEVRVWTERSPSEKARKSAARRVLAARRRDEPRDQDRELPVLRTGGGSGWSTCGTRRTVHAHGRARPGAIGDGQEEGDWVRSADAVADLERR
jgi:hypothetical protein